MPLLTRDLRLRLSLGENLKDQNVGFVCDGDVTGGSLQ